MYSLKKKIVLITGASSGIGEACAKAFAALGSKLILGARRIERLTELSKSLTAEFGVEVLPLKIDVTNFNELEESINGLPSDWREIEVLVNNAGLSLRLDKVSEANIGDWDQMIDTNVKGVLYLTRLILPGMIERGRGHIINLGSIAGEEVYPGGNVYCASKAAVKFITQGTRLDVNGTGVRVSLIEPGMTKTEFAEVRWSGDREKADQMYIGVDYLTGADVAEAIVFCATRPPHVNIGQLLLTPTQQASVSMTHRRKE